MHNQTALCERTRAPTQARTAIRTPSGDQGVTSLPKCTAKSSHFLRRARGPETADGQLASFKEVSELVPSRPKPSGEHRETADGCVRYASSVVLSRSRASGQPPNTALAECAGSPIFRAGLSPWQLRSLTAHIDASLNTSLHCGALARLAGLSVSHFTRKFKYTFGLPPHAFLVRRRMERTQWLMGKSAVPLAQIATDCGFYDQAHFSRLFLQATGASPGTWRRARVCEIAAKNMISTRV
jgi:AraC family transcriptional regulator